MYRFYNYFCSSANFTTNKKTIKKAITLTDTALLGFQCLIASLMM